jgi:hypothetical protein
MVEFSTTERADSASEHFTVLKKYANRVVLEGQTLSEAEAEDKEARLQEVREFGDRYGFSDKDVVKLIFGRIFSDRKQCGCPTCRARRQMRIDKAGRGA